MATSSGGQQTAVRERQQLLCAVETSLKITVIVVGSIGWLVFIAMLGVLIYYRRRHRLDQLCASRSSASDYSNFRFPVMPRGPATQYPLTTTTNTTATTTTATKPRDLDSIAASYESVNDEKSNGKSSDTTSGRTVSKSGQSVDVGCDWVVSPGWKLRRRVADESVANQLPSADDAASPSGRRENVDDMGCQSPQEMVAPTPPPPLPCDVDTTRKKRHLSSTVRANKNSYRL